MDFTERNAKEEALRQMHRALRALSQCSSAVVHATDEQAPLNEVCRLRSGRQGISWSGWVVQTTTQRAPGVR